MPSSKYRSKQVFWDASSNQAISRLEADKYRIKGKLRLPPNIERFDSTLEFNVYRKLIDLFGKSRVVRQHPLLIFPNGYCYPKGKRWKVDFAIRSVYTLKGFSHFVEAKGVLLQDFRHTLAALESHSDEDFYKLRIIWGGGIPQDSAFVRNLLKTDFRNHMYSFRQFEKLRRLL